MQCLLTSLMGVPVVFRAEWNSHSTHSRVGHTTDMCVHPMPIRPTLSPVVNTLRILYFPGWGLGIGSTPEEGSRGYSSQQ